MLDLCMPDLSGFEVLHMLKENPRTAGIPVIIHTSKSLDPQDEELLREASALLNKGAKTEELSITHFADAFQKAGFRITPAPDRVQHA